MKEIFDSLKALFSLSAPVLALLMVVLYFMKFSIEKRIDSGFKARERRADEESRRREHKEDELVRRIENIGKTSLDVKKGLREEEREHLVALRVAVEKWEYFLQTAVFDFSMLDAAKADVRSLYNADKELFLEVRVAVVKAGTYLRNRALEQQLTGAILKIRQVYYPLMNEALFKLIDLQAEIKPIQNKLAAFEQSGMKDMAFAPTEKDRDDNLRLQAAMTAEVGTFRDRFLGQFRSIAEQMNDLKEAVNFYIYRPITHTGIDRD